LGACSAVGQGYSNYRRKIAGLHEPELTRFAHTGLDKDEAALMARFLAALTLLCLVQIWSIDT